MRTRLKEQLEAFPRPEDPRDLRPIHYLGSKLRLVPALRELVNQLDIEGGRLCDLFAGSGTVAAAFSRSRPVVAVDVQEYARVICSAVLLPADVPRNLAEQISKVAEGLGETTRLFEAIEPLVVFEEDCIRAALDGEPGPLCDLLETGSLYGLAREPRGVSSTRASKEMRAAYERLTSAGLSETRSSMVTRYFGGVYFSFRQAAELDSLLEAIERCDPSYRTTLIAAVLGTASDAVNTVGKQFAQPLKPRTSDGKAKANLGERVQRDRALSIQELFASWVETYRGLAPTRRKHEAIRSDYRDFLRGYRKDLAVIYADPPYTRDHYSRFYHVLETMCLRDNPTVSTNKVRNEVRLSRGGYRSDRHQSPFCIRSEAPAAFEALFTEARRFDCPLVLSYSPFDSTVRTHPRAVTIDNLLAIAKRVFRKCDIVSAGPIRHNKLNASDRLLKASDEAELFLVCRP
jgi:adenine-specific DNA methylase